MRIERITTLAAFEGFEAEWQALLPETAADTIFLTWEWIHSWWKSYGRGKELSVLVARDASGNCQGIAPFYVEPYRQMGRTLRRLRFLGDGSSDSDYLDFLIASGHESQVLAGFLEELRALASVWDVAQLNEVPESSPNGKALAGWLARSGWLLHREEVPCGVVFLPQDWDSYLKMLKPRFRTAVRGSLRDLEEWGGTIEYLTEQPQIERWLDEFFSLHASRWQHRGKEGVFADLAKREFYQRLCHTLLQRDWLHFARLRVKGVTLACQFGFNYRDTYHQLQEGFDISSAHASPGIMLRAVMIRDLIRRGVQTYDFLSGLGRHKTDWGATPKRSWRWAIAPRTAAGFSYVILPLARDRAKEHLERVLPGRIVGWLRNSRRGGASKEPFPAASVLTAPKHQGSWRETVARAIYQTGALRLVRSLTHSYELTPERNGRWASFRHVSSPKFVVLSYHRVGQGGIPLYSSLPAETFEAQIRLLRKHYRIVSLDQLYEEMQSPKPSGQAVAITFDDGYRDTYSRAFPILRKYQVPATVFLTVGSIETGEVAWYDRVFLAFQVAPGEKLDIFLDRPHRFYLTTPEARSQAALKAIGLMRRLPDQRRHECCAAIEGLVPLPQSELAERMLTWEHIRAMQQAGIAFGSHTLSHPVVSQLAPAALERELLESKQILEHRIGASVKDFAFPFGKSEDCGSAARTVLARCGYRLAVTTVPGVNRPGNDPFALFRSSIGEENSVPMFAFHLHQLFFHVKEQGRGATLPAVSPAHEPAGSRERFAS